MRFTLAALAAALLWTGTAAAAPAKPLPLPLHAGQCGPQVAGVQWMLAGHRPSAYRGVSTFGWKVNGCFGARTKWAVVKMKYRLGFPSSALTPVAGGDFLRILRGQVARPHGYLARAAARVPHRKASPTPQTWQAHLIAVERTQLGASEIPDGSNWGPKVAGYIGAIGLDRPVAWCAAFQQWSRLQAGMQTIANRSGGVFFIVDYARARGWAHAAAYPGDLAAFLDFSGHIGLVESVTPTTYTTLEGNEGNAVRRVVHVFGQRPVIFITAGPEAH